MLFKNNYSCCKNGVVDIRHSRNELDLRTLLLQPESMYSLCSILQKKKTTSLCLKNEMLPTKKMASLEGLFQHNVMPLLIFST